jgi:hypothetical protein
MILLGSAQDLSAARAKAALSSLLNAAHFGVLMTIDIDVSQPEIARNQRVGRVFVGFDVKRTVDIGHQAVRFVVRQFGV